MGQLADTRSETDTAGAPPWPKVSVLNVIPLAALALFGWMFMRHINTLDGTAIWAALTGLALWQWIAALAFTALSFRAIGLYDVLVHRVLNTGQTTKDARAAGVKAIALSQTLGFGALTSALVRWRCLPALPAPAILRLSAIVSISFLAALAAVTALLVPLSGLVPRSGALVAGGLAAVVGLILLARLAHHLGWIPAPVRGGTLLALITATAADTAFAAAALWVLWPDAISFHLLMAAYLVALGAGLMSNAPGGVGAFDLTFLALIPVSDDAAGVAALLAFRVIYYAIPAGLALIGLIRPAAAPTKAIANHPEGALALQTAQIHPHPKAPLLTLPCWGNGALLGDLPAQVQLHDLRSSSSPRALYKCSARQAAHARAAGWAVLRCSQDALLDLPNWSTDGSSRRQLRRALNAFGANRLRIRETRDMAQLRDVAAAWADAHGAEKGLSMGRYCPDYLRHQRVFAAYDGITPVAFVSFHTGDIWTLDLMRHAHDTPNGTMQALICAGIEAAKSAQAKTLSLASVPAPAPSFPGAARIRSGAAGLIRFKSAFGPTWQPRFACAPNWPHLALTLATLTYAIHRPGPLPPSPNAIHPHHEDFSFAPSRLPCDPHPLTDGANAHDQSPCRPS